MLKYQSLTMRTLISSKVVAGKCVCALFGHVFGEWEYLNDRSCWQLRTCKRDGYQEHAEHLSHVFGDWKKVATGSCELKRVCERDGYEERKIFHSFSQWTYIADRSCKQTRICAIDGVVETGTEHCHFVSNDNPYYHTCERCSNYESHDHKTQYHDSMFASAGGNILSQTTEDYCPGCGYTHSSTTVDI